MRPSRGSIILPDKPLRRFRLPELPPEGRAVARAERRWRRAFYGALWLAFTGVCLGFSGGSLPSLSASSAPEPARRTDLTPPQRSLQARSSGVASDVGASESGTLPPARLSLAPMKPLERQLPSTHSGSGSVGFFGFEPEPLPQQSGPEGSWPEGSSSEGSWRQEEPRELAARQQTHAEPTPERTYAGDPLAETSDPRRGEPLRSLAALGERAGPEPEPRAERPVWTSMRSRGCEEAAQSHVEEFTIGEAEGPDLPASAFASLLEDFGNYSGCGLDQEMTVSVCVAVLAGKARGVTVKTQPGHARVSSCVAAAVERLRFPHSPRMDVVRTELVIR